MPQEQFQSEEKRNQNPQSRDFRRKNIKVPQVAGCTRNDAIRNFFRRRKKKKTFEGKVLSTSPPELGTLNVSRTKFERSSLPLR